MRITTGEQLLQRLDSSGLSGVKLEGGHLKTRNAFAGLLRKIGDAFLSLSEGGRRTLRQRGAALHDAMAEKLRDANLDGARSQDARAVIARLRNEGRLPAAPRQPIQEEAPRQPIREAPEMPDIRDLLGRMGHIRKQMAQGSIPGLGAVVQEALENGMRQLDTKAANLGMPLSPDVREALNTAMLRDVRRGAQPGPTIWKYDGLLQSAHDLARKFPSDQQAGVFSRLLSQALLEGAGREEPMSEEELTHVMDDAAAGLR